MREEEKEGGTGGLGGKTRRPLPPPVARPGSAERSALCAGSSRPSPWSCAVGYPVAGTWWDTCPGRPPGRAGPQSATCECPAPPPSPPPPGSCLTSSRVWGPGASGSPCRRLSTARFMFSAQRGSARWGHRWATRPACRTKRSGWRPRAALGTVGGSHTEALRGARPSLHCGGRGTPAPTALGQSA